MCCKYKNILYFCGVKQLKPHAMKLHWGEQKFLIRRKNVDDLCVAIKPYREVWVLDFQKENDKTPDTYLVKFVYAGSDDICTLRYVPEVEFCDSKIHILTDNTSDYYLFDTEEDAVGFLKYYVDNMRNDCRKKIESLNKTLEGISNYIENVFVFKNQTN